MLPKGGIVAVRLSPANISEYPAKVAPRWASPWVVVKKSTGDKTYRVQDVVTKAERQVTRDQLKLLGLPEEIEASWLSPWVRECGLTEGAVSKAAWYTALGITPRLEKRGPPKQRRERRAGTAGSWLREGGRTLSTVETFFHASGGTVEQGPPGVQGEESLGRGTTLYDGRRAASRRSRAVEEARALSRPARRGRRRVWPGVDDVRS